MSENQSENIFRDYLNRYSFDYDENFVVGDESNPKNVDFFIKTRKINIYADVKEVKDSSEGDIVDAHENIRKDIRKLRDKFGQKRPIYPVILVTMNYSSKFFTGFTIARALLGEVGVYFSAAEQTPIHHLPRGNAVLTQKHNRTISAVLCFDRVNQNHYLFKSPFADHPIPDELFPSVKAIKLDRNADESRLRELSSIMFNED